MVNISNSDTDTDTATIKYDRIDQENYGFQKMRLKKNSLEIITA